MASLTQRIRQQFATLIVQFLLGMSVNLIGLPDEVDSKTLKLIDQFAVGLHVLIAIGLIVTAIGINRVTSKQAPGLRKLAGGGGGGVGVAILGGIGTFALHGGWSNVASFVMAVGFIGAILAYGQLYVRAQAIRA